MKQFKSFVYKDLRNELDKWVLRLRCVMSQEQSMRGGPNVPVTEWFVQELARYKAGGARSFNKATGLRLGTFREMQRAGRLTVSFITVETACKTVPLSVANAVDFGALDAANEKEREIVLNLISSVGDKGGNAEQVPADWREVIGERLGQRMLTETRTTFPGNVAVDGPLPFVHTLIVGTTNNLPMSILSGVSQFLGEWATKADLEFREYDDTSFIANLRDGTVAFGIGLEQHGEHSADLTMHPLVQNLDTVFVCHPSHELAERSRKEKTRTIALDDLRGRRLYVVRGQSELGGRHVDDEIQRIPVANLSAALEFAQLDIQGGAIVPGWYPFLNELRKRGKLYYLQVTDCDPVGVSIYYRKRKTLSPVERALIYELQDYIQFRATGSHWQVPEGERDFKAHFAVHALETYRFKHYVTSDHTGYTEPEWRVAEITWIGSCRASGGEGLAVNEHDGVHFGIEATVRDRILYLVGTIKADDGLPENYDPHDQYVHVFNAFGEDDTVVGMWVGQDNNHHPLAAVSVLAKKRLNGPELRRIAETSLFRSLQSADDFRNEWLPEQRNYDVMRYLERHQEGEYWATADELELTDDRCHEYIYEYPEKSAGFLGRIRRIFVVSDVARFKNLPDANRPKLAQQLQRGAQLKYLVPSDEETIENVAIFGGFIVGVLQKDRSNKLNKHHNKQMMSVV